ncbi:hypothetical protein GYMLUDRAFT_889369 [Collybiopsis luxurians FD-317 M1]|uniref:Uncharacterized protein n=1 Tax=Collybiopsis luxurians FD-317 M1 TaxID=944289 RepID=A0A0D0BJK3_9AGAR|nr:hypothetical protein GYMLUDRAFT_889369 [Collybiopsis luxurians FD-317 M1]
MHDGRRSSLTLMDKYLDCLPSAFGGVLSHSPLHPSGLFQPFDSSYISPRWKTFSRNNAQFSELNSSYETGRSVVKPSRSSRRSKMALKPGSSQTTSGTSVDTTRPEPSSYSNTRSHVSHNSTLLMEDAASLSTSSRPRSESSPRRKEAPCSAPLSFYSSSHSSLPRNRHGPGIDFPPSEPSTQQDRASHPSRPSLSSPDESRNQSTLSHSNSNLGSDPSSLQVPSGRAGSRIFDLPLVPGGNEAEGNGVDTDTEGDGGLDIYDIIADVDGLCYPEEGEDDRERLSYSLGTSANEDGKTLALVKSESEPSRLSAFVASSDSYGTAAKRRSTSPPPPLPEPSSFQPPGTLSALPTSSLAVVGHQIPPPPWAKLPLQAPVPPSLSLHGQWPSRTSRKRKRKTGDGVEVEVSPSSSRGAASTCASALATPASTPMRTRTRTRIRSTNNDTGSEVEHEHEHEHENEAGDDSVDILSTPGHRRHHRVITYRMRTTHGQTVLKEDYMANFLQGVGGEAEDGRRMIKGKAKSYERVEVERERELRPRGLRLREVLEDETDTDEDGDDDEHTGVGGGSSRSGRTRAPSVLTGGPVVDAVKENVDPFGSIDAAGVEQGEVERNLDDS